MFNIQKHHSIPVRHFKIDIGHPSPPFIYLSIYIGIVWLCGEVAKKKNTHDINRHVHVKHETHLTTSVLNYKHVAIK